MGERTPSLAAEIEALREAYAALNRNDVAGFVKDFDPQIERIEPADLPGGGTYPEKRNEMARRAYRGCLHFPERQGHSVPHIRRQAAGARMGRSRSLSCKLSGFVRGSLRARCIARIAADLRWGNAVENR
jgi:hypothetical protein